MVNWNWCKAKFFIFIAITGNSIRRSAVVADYSKHIFGIFSEAIEWSKPAKDPAKKTEADAVVETPVKPAAKALPKNPLYDAKEGEWVRFKTTGPQGQEVIMMTTVSEVSDDEVGDFMLNKEFLHFKNSKCLSRHKTKTKTGSNGFQKVVRCKECNALLYFERLL